MDGIELQGLNEINLDSFLFGGVNLTGLPFINTSSIEFLHFKSKLLDVNREIWTNPEQTINSV